MNRNDYRRAFIMLRAAIPGYGGHVRLERRTLTGSMYFIVTAPQGAGPLVAALAGQRNGEYYATPIGSLASDRRGQLTLAWQFDPRAVNARPLEAYAWVVVARRDDCAVALTGNVDSHRPMDQVALSRAVCAAVAPPEEPAADLPEELPPPAEAETPAPEAETPAPEARTPAAEIEKPEPIRGDVKVYTRMRSRLRPAHARAATPPPEAAPPAEADARIPAGEAPSRTAAAALGLDITAPWPGTAESLRRLFATQAPADAPLGDGYTYISSPLPACGGSPGCLIGLRVEGGVITGIRYALPGAYAPEPPAGLDGYAWRATHGGSGYWILDVAPSGSPES